MVLSQLHDQKKLHVQKKAWIIVKFLVTLEILQIKDNFFNATDIATYPV